MATKLASVNVRAKLPLELEIRREVRVGLLTIESHTIWMPRHRWERLAMSADPAWDLLHVGPFVVANRLRYWRS